MAKFQCTDINGDFHVGDGRVILGPYKDPITKESHEGGIDEIDDDIAAAGVEQKRGKIIK